MVKQIMKRLRSEKLPDILTVQTTALRVITNYMAKHRIPQIMPILLSPITDPLNHEVFEAEISYYGQRLKLTKSITVHKPLVLMGELKAFYCFSPNIRLEIKQRARSGRHLIEFTQLEMEFKGYDKWQFMSFVEGLVKHIIAKVKEECKEELKHLGRKLTVPKGSFKVYESKEAVERHGPEFERALSEKAREPFWLLDFKREFYDREDKHRRGYYHNYDLVWPEGFCEALSGGEREYEYEEIVRKMKERGTNLTPYKHYLELLKTGKVPKTSGGGLGIERLVRFLTGAKHIDEVTIFPRAPGKKIIL